MYLELGTGDPVVFVHGIASTHATWEAVRARLSPYFRCVTYDLRGHDLAELQKSLLTVDTLIDDLEQLRRTLGLEEMRLVGHSLGAFIVAGYAVKHPSRVRALALLAAPAGRSEADLQAGAQLIAAMKTDGLRHVMPRLIDSWYSSDFVKLHPDVLERRLAEIDSINDEVVTRTYEIYYQTEITPWLEKLALPTLVMTGRYARGCGADVARFIARRLSKASLVILEGQRNGLLTEAPERVAAELLRFFREH